MMIVDALQLLVASQRGDLDATKEAIGLGANADEIMEVTVTATSSGYVHLIPLRDKML